MMNPLPKASKANKADNLKTVFLELCSPKPILIDGVSF